MVRAKQFLRLLQAAFAGTWSGRLITWRAPRSVPKVAITFDDGPHEHTTPRLLALLRDAGIRCTFFLLGRELVKHPEVAKMIAAGGHEIGIHGFDHSAHRICSQIARCEEELRQNGIGYARLFRPAMGRRGLGALPAIRRRGFKTVLWSFDAFDSMRHESKRTENPDYSAIRPGDIILMHDDNPVCLAELPGLIADVRGRGLEPVTVSELMGWGQ